MNSVDLEINGTIWKNFLTNWPGYGG
jgi:hypothetical protein